MFWNIDVDMMAVTLRDSALSKLTCLECTNPRSGFEFQSCQCIAQVVKPGLRPKCRRRPATKFKACSYCSYTCQAVQSSCWNIWSILRAVLVLHGRIQGILGDVSQGHVISLCALHMTVMRVSKRFSSVAPFNMMQCQGKTCSGTWQGLATPLDSQ